jgi:hypothetical protein
VGTVGAGKSTHMKLLASKLKKNNYKVTTTSLKSGHLFAYFLELLLVKLLSLQSEKDSSLIKILVEKRPQLFRKLFKLIVALDVVSIYCRFLFVVYIPKKLGYILIVEEYIPATIADYVALAGFVGVNQKCLPIFLNLFSKLTYLGEPIHTVLLDASNDTLENRWVHRKSPFQRFDYLNMQRTLLFSVSKKLSSSFLFINNNDKTIENTSNLIMNFLYTDSTNA